MIQNYENIEKKIKELHPDILHSVQLNPIVELVSRKLQIPHVMNIYQLLPDFFSIKYMDIFPGYHICDSYYYANKWSYYLGTESTCIRTVVSNEKKKYEKKRIKNEYLNYMCVGCVCERKNQLSVIKAFHKAIQSGIKGYLSIYGYCDGEYAARCKKYIVDQRIENNVMLKGFSTDIEIEYQKNDVLICGSTMESYPNVISEALANNLVVISTPVAGVPEIIIDHYNGYLCNGFNESDIFEKIMELNSEKYLLNTTLKNAHETFEKYHCSKLVSEQLLNYYSNLAKKGYRKKRVLIDTIRKKFNALLLTYVKNMNKFSDNNAVEQKLWYIYHIEKRLIRKVLKEKKRVYVWGTGKYGKIVKEILEVFWSDFTINGYIDSYKTGFFEGYKIHYSKDIIIQKEVIIIIAAVKGQEEMIQQLKSNNKVYNLDYFILSPRVW